MHFQKYMFFFQMRRKKAKFLLSAALLSSAMFCSSLLCSSVSAEMKQTVDMETDFVAAASPQTTIQDTHNEISENSKTNSEKVIDAESADTKNETDTKTADIETETDAESADAEKTDGPKTDEKIEALFEQLSTRLPSENGLWAVYVSDLVNKTESSINDKSMQAASLIKLYIMGAVYENYETLTNQYGQGNVDSNLYSMITVSDNEAANALVSYLGNGDSNTGMSIVNDFCLAHDFTATHMGRLLLQSNQFGDNYTSVADCGHLLKAIYEKKTEEFPYAEAMFDLLSHQQRKHKIPAQLPEGVHTASKTGELSDVENDAAILYDTDNDLVIVFMSEYLASPGSAQSLIAELSRQIYDYYNA